MHFIRFLIILSSVYALPVPFVVRPPSQSLSPRFNAEFEPETVWLFDRAGEQKKKGKKREASEDDPAQSQDQTQGASSSSVPTRQGPTEQAPPVGSYLDAEKARKKLKRDAKKPEKRVYDAKRHQEKKEERGMTPLYTWTPVPGQTNPSQPAPLPAPHVLSAPGQPGASGLAQNQWARPPQNPPPNPFAQGQQQRLGQSSAWAAPQPGSHQPPAAGHPVHPPSPPSPGGSNAGRNAGPKEDSSALGQWNKMPPKETKKK